MNGDCCNNEPRCGAEILLTFDTGRETVCKPGFCQLQRGHEGPHQIHGVSVMWTTSEQKQEG